MNKAFRSIFVLAVAATPLAVALPAAAAAGQAPATGASAADDVGILLQPGQCRNQTVNFSGGEGSVKICRSADGGQLDINGHIRDADSDGRCAQLYGYWSGTSVRWESPQACPKGEVRYFNRSYKGVVDTTVYGRTVDA